MVDGAFHEELGLLLRSHRRQRFDFMVRELRRGSRKRGGLELINLRSPYRSGISPGKHGQSQSEAENGEETHSAVRRLWTNLSGQLSTWFSHGKGRSADRKSTRLNSSH